MAENGSDAPLLRPSRIQTNLPPVIGLFLTVFLDLLSFGIFIPDIQLRAKSFGASGFFLGAILGIYSLAQLISAPYLGRISDFVSRRQVLLIASGIATLSYLAYGAGTSLPMMIFSRVLSGIAAASLGVAFAYMADITKPEERSKGLGLLGAAFGLGFIIGPVMGGLLLAAGKDSPLLLGLVGAGMSAVNFFYIYLLLPDPYPKPQTAEQSQRSNWQNLRAALQNPNLAILLVLFFAAQFGFTNLETTFFQLLADPRSIFHLDVASAKTFGSYVLGVVGIMGVLVQGFLVRIMTPKFGEVKLLRFAYLCMTPALASVPLFPLWWPGIIVIFFLSLGSGLAQPSLSSLISRNAPPEMQGGIFGVTQSLGSLARLLGPLVSNTLFQIQPAYPYFAGALMLFIPMFGVWTLRQPASGEPSETVAAH